MEAFTFVLALVTLTAPKVSGSKVRKTAPDGERGRSLHLPNVPRWCPKERERSERRPLGTTASQGYLDMFVHCPALMLKCSRGFRTAAKTEHSLFLLNLHF